MNSFGAVVKSMRSADGVIYCASFGVVAIGVLVRTRGDLLYDTHLITKSKSNFWNVTRLQLWLRKSHQSEIAQIEVEDDSEVCNLAACLDMKTAKLLMIHEAIGKDDSYQMVIENTKAAASTLLRAERVNLVMITRDIDGRLMTSDSFQPGVGNNYRIEAIVAATGKTVCSNDANNDGTFVIYPTEKKDEKSNCLCAAIKSQQGEVIGVITAFTKCYCISIKFPIWSTYNRFTIFIIYEKYRYRTTEK